MTLLHISTKCLSSKLARWMLATTVVFVVCVRYINLQFPTTLTHKSTRSKPDVITQEDVCRLPLPQQHKISCQRIIQGDGDYIKSLASVKWERNQCQSQNKSQDDICRHVVRQYPVRDEELDLPLAFTLKVHKDHDQVIQLLRAIHRPHNTYCIHVDVKAEVSVFQELQKVAKCFNNVIVIQKVNVVYGSIGLLLSDKVCMEELVTKKTQWKYYLNMAGQEFPLKTNLEIVRILKTLHGRNEIESYPFPERLNKRFRTIWIVRNNKLVNTLIPKAPFKHNIPFRKGSMYGMFTRGFVNFVLSNTIAKDLIIWAKETYAPEELVWATLNSLSGTPGGYNVSVTHSEGQFLSRAMVWEWDMEQCQGKFVRHVCVFGHRDLPWLASAPEIVANKFHSDFDQLVVDCLDEWLHNKTMMGETANLNWFFYSNTPHAKLKANT